MVTTLFPYFVVVGSFLFVPSIRFQIAQQFYLQSSIQKSVCTFEYRIVCSIDSSAATLMQLFRVLLLNFNVQCSPPLYNEPYSSLFIQNQRWIELESITTCAFELSFLNLDWYLKGQFTCKTFNVRVVVDILINMLMFIVTGKTTLLLVKQTYSLVGRLNR